MIILDFFSFKSLSNFYFSLLVVVYTDFIFISSQGFLTNMLYVPISINFLNIIYSQFYFIL